MIKALLVILLTLLLPWSSAQATAEQVEAHTVVLALPQDDYYPLAQEVSAAEALPLVESWEQALASDPSVILWIAAPRSLSDQVMVAAGRALKNHAGLPAVGILSGSTLEEARQLWLRGQQQREAHTSQRFFAANAEYPTAGIDHARLIAFQSDPSEPSALTRQSLADALQQADYLTFTGHGADRYLRLDPATQMFASDLPALPPIVVSAASCQTFRLWREDSIALGFVEKGAAAYAGFVYSPLEGYMIGQFQDLPFRYSWPDFPIGNIMALQSRGTMQGFAEFPYYYLLGDPRIALQAAPPYQLVDDVTHGATRTLTFRNAPQGLIPVRVSGGGRYAFVEVPGLTATADGDPFFNARLQAASLDGDKWIIFIHPGGDFTIRLVETAPWHWWLTHPLLSAFDDVALTSPQNGGDMLMLALGAVSLGIVLLRVWKLRRQAGGFPFRRMAYASLAVALTTTLLLGLYQVLRLPHAVITTKPLALTPLWVLAVFLITFNGCALFFLFRSRFARLLALLLVVAPALLPGVFGIAAVASINLLASREIGAGFYNLHLGSLPLIAAAPWLLLVSIALFVTARRINPKTDKFSGPPVI